MKKSRFFGFALLISVIFSVISQAAVEAPIDKQNVYTAEKISIQGGEITDGRDLRDIRWGRHNDFERIVLDIYEGAYLKKGPSVPIPCYFVVKYEYYPFRFTVTLGGIRARKAEFGSFPWSCIFEETYSLPYLDDSGLEFAIGLKGPVEFEVFELHNPGRIVIDVRENPERMELPEVFSLRTETGLGVEELGYLEEIMLGLESKNPRIIKAADDKLFFEEGYYLDKETALERKEEISQHVEWVDFFVEKRGPTSIPE